MHVGSCGRIWPRDMYRINWNNQWNNKRVMLPEMCIYLKGMRGVYACSVCLLTSSILIKASTETNPNKRHKVYKVISPGILLKRTGSSRMCRMARSDGSSHKLRRFAPDQYFRRSKLHASHPVPQNSKPKTNPRTRSVMGRLCDDHFRDWGYPPKY